MLLQEGDHVGEVVVLDLGKVEHAMGILMVITGIGFLTGSVTSISIWLLETFPALQNFG